MARDFDADCQVETVNRQRWKGKRNGELLEQAAETFDVLVTMDKGFKYQQNISKYAIGVVIISTGKNRSNRLEHIQPAMLEVNQVLRDVKPGQVIYVKVKVS